MSNDEKNISIKEIIETFGASKRTIERKIARGEIKPESIKIVNGTRFVEFSELVRVFGTPKTTKQEIPKAPQVPAISDTPAPEPKPEIEKKDDSELVALLKEQLAKSEAREKAEKERADALQAELSDARKRNDELANGLILKLHQQTLELPSPSQNGVWNFIKGFFKR